MKKKALRRFTLLLLTLCLIFSSSLTAFAAVKKVTGTYHQTDARKMLSMINTFRTGKQAWYYEKDGSSKKVKLTNLKKLQYDYNLEKVAMQRAAEISVYWNHTRPDGTSCFTAYPKGYNWMGENIAYGTGSLMTTKYTMELWKETDQPYSGQGHRRNMLNRNFTCVGIACFEVNGMKYWVQEFGNPVIGKQKTAAVNKRKTVKVTVK